MRRILVAALLLLPIFGWTADFEDNGYLTERYCNPDLATGDNDGTSEANAWQSIATAFANVERGERINFKRCATRVGHTSTATLSTVAAATDQMIHLRGYETTIGDGGYFQTNWTSGAYLNIEAPGVIVENFDITGTGTARVLRAFYGGVIKNCTIDFTGTGTGCYAVSLVYSSAVVCDVTMTGQTDSDACAISTSGGIVMGCRLYSTGSGLKMDNSYRDAVAIGNRISGSTSSTGHGIYILNSGNGGTFCIANNTVYDFANGIYFNDEPDAAETAPRIITDNLLVNCSAYGISTANTTNSGFIPILNTGFYSITSGNYNMHSDAAVMNTIQLTAGPFVDTVDFKLNNTAGGGLLLKDVGIW